MKIKQSDFFDMDTQPGHLSVKTGRDCNAKTKIHSKALTYLSTCTCTWIYGELC